MKKYISMLAVILLSFAHESTAHAISSKQYKVKEGFLLVRRKASANTVSIASIHAKANAVVVQQFGFPEGLELVQLKPGIASAASIETYKQDPNVLYVEPDYIWTKTGIPNDNYFAKQWGLNNVGQTGGTPDSDINAIEAFDHQMGNPNVVLASIDTGVDYNHPDLIHNIWTNINEIPGNHIDDDNNGYIDDIHGMNAITNSGDPMDDNEHGTHVAGIMAAENNNSIGISGVMPHASVVACKFLNDSGSGDTADAIKCMNYLINLKMRAQNPVQIVAINNSWAGGPYSQALYDAIKQTQQAGILFMAAASNEGQNNDVVATYPANFRLSNVLSVAAIDHKDNLASFSNRGRFSVHVAAPGVDIFSTIPNNKYLSLNGTSMATPFVTALAGMIKSNNASLDWIGIKNLIISGGQITNGAYKNTISGRRVRMWDITGEGSLTCRNQIVTARLLPKTSFVSIRLGQSLTLSILNINCDKPNVNVRATATATAAPAPIRLLDNGAGLDEVANDGVFNGAYKPTAIGTYRLAFPGNDILTVQVTR